jgi:hypothetical protein
MPTYCGNNSIHPSLQNGVVLGNRYSCLRKGIGKGLSMPYDVNYTHPFVPIDPTRIYCGTNNNLPEGYDRFGNLPQCLQTGIAIGKIQKAQRGPPLMFRQHIILMIFAVLLFAILYVNTPSFLTNTVDNITKIDWLKFTLFYIQILILFYFIR